MGGVEMHYIRHDGQADVYVYDFNSGGWKRRPARIPRRPKHRKISFGVVTVSALAMVLAFMVGALYGFVVGS